MWIFNWAGLVPLSPAFFKGQPYTHLTHLTSLRSEYYLPFLQMLNEVREVSSAQCQTAAKGWIWASAQRSLALKLIHGLPFGIVHLPYPWLLPGCDLVWVSIFFSEVGAGECMKLALYVYLTFLGGGGGNGEDRELLYQGSDHCRKEKQTLL